MCISEKKETFIGLFKVFIILLFVTCICFYFCGMAVAGCVFLIGIIYLLLLCNLNCYTEYNFTKDGFSSKTVFGRIKRYTWDELEIVYTRKDIVSVAFKDTHEDLLVLNEGDIKEFEEFMKVSDIDVTVNKL